MALAGVKILQYRNKSANRGQEWSRPHALRMLTREFGALFIVNDDARLAAHVDADGVHVSNG